jgi:acyl-CoA reductase-like NAD-dependent aldehyde dehydrogenase
MLSDVPEDALIMHEEIFGPILPIVGVNSTEDAINYVNS